jgi:hypothetical protein
LHLFLSPHPLILCPSLFASLIWHSSKDAVRWQGMSPGKTSSVPQGTTRRDLNWKLSSSKGMLHTWMDFPPAHPKHTVILVYRPSFFETSWLVAICTEEGNCKHKCNASDLCFQYPFVSISMHTTHVSVYMKYLRLGSWVEICTLKSFQRLPALQRSTYPDCKYRSSIQNWPNIARHLRAGRNTVHSEQFNTSVLSSSPQAESRLNAHMLRFISQTCSASSAKRNA